MRIRRERIFDCSYGPTGNEGHLVFRAWTAVEAASGVEEAMERAGIPLVGAASCSRCPSIRRTPRGSPAQPDRPPNVAGPPRAPG